MEFSTNTVKFGQMRGIWGKPVVFGAHTVVSLVNTVEIGGKFIGIWGK